MRVALSPKCCAKFYKYLLKFEFKVMFWRPFAYPIALKFVIVLVALKFSLNSFKFSTNWILTPNFRTELLISRRNEIMIERFSLTGLTKSSTPLLPQTLGAGSEFRTIAIQNAGTYDTWDGKRGSETYSWAILEWSRDKMLYPTERRVSAATTQ